MAGTRCPALPVANRVAAGRGAFHDEWERIKPASAMHPNRVYFYDANLGQIREDGEWIPSGSIDSDFIDMKYRPKLPGWF